ncbi:MAG: radical SAM protein [Clostridia bacterium]|nr:radical SAM protein [Clostridia bacterium]
MLIIPIFVPHAGCPHDCCFCDQKKISGHKEPPSVEEIKKTVDSYLDIIKNYSVVQIAFFGGSFTAIPREMQEMFLQAVNPYIREGLVDSLRLSTRPDYIDGETLSMLKSYSVKTIELGAQSMDDDVLIASGRGHTSTDTARAAELIRAYGFELGLQTMTGLPGASYESDLYTADRIIDLNPQLVRIYPTVVIRDTFLHKMYEKGTYNPPSLDKTIDLCAELMIKYENKKVKVIRMGLQSSDGISVGEDVVAGPYHPAFGQLVKSRIAYDKLAKMAEDNLANGKDDSESRVFTASVPYKELSDYIGQKNVNVIRLKEQFGYEKVIIKPIK